jgi:hypothetical protein
MATYFAAVAEQNAWELRLHNSPWHPLGFYLKPAGAHGLFYRLPEEGQFGRETPMEIQSFYHLVGGLWWGFPFADGGIDAFDDTAPLADCDWFNEERAGLDGRMANLWGLDSRGHVLWFARDGQAGWYNYHSHAIVWSSVRLLLDWLFGELLAGREPVGQTELAEQSPAPDRPHD